MRSYSGLCVEFPALLLAPLEGISLAPLEEIFQEESAETPNGSSCAEYHLLVLNPV